MIKYPIIHSFKMSQEEIDWLQRDGERLGTQMHNDLKLLKNLYETMRKDPKKSIRDCFVS